MSGRSAEDREIEARLQAVKAARGYLLPHHGLLAITSEAMLAAYDRAYRALALDPRVLSVRDREFVWLAVLIATDEGLATHHLPRFKEGGGTNAEILVAVRLAAWAGGADAYEFVERWWTPHLPGLDVDAAYRETLRTLADGAPLRLALLAVASVHAACNAPTLLKRAIRLAYAERVPEPELAEALSIVMFPGSVPYFVEAARAWLDLIRAGEVEPSPAFAAWARLEGQGGYDETRGKGGQ
jgi:alkylhydroperoxidase/carboxymuconolactone decarboxylase family protein YurZ